MTGLVAGTAAAIAPKSDRFHAVAGKVFVAAMLVMAGVGALVAPPLTQRVNIAAAVFTLYLVLSAWMTVRHKSGDAGRIEAATMLVGMAALRSVWLIWIGNQSVDGTVDGQDYHPAFVFACLAALACCWICACCAVAAYSTRRAWRAMYGACAWLCSSRQGLPSWAAPAFSHLGAALERAVCSGPGTAGAACGVDGSGARWQAVAGRGCVLRMCRTA